MEATQEQIEKAVNDLKGGFYGTAEIVDDFENDNYYLVRTEIADPNENENWECAEYHLLKKDLSESHYIANCNGYDGVQLQMSQDDIDTLLGEDNDLDEYLTNYNITGDLLAEAKLNASTEATDDYIGECKIWVEYCYSSGTLNKPSDSFVVDDNYEEIIFDNYQDAEGWIDNNIAETYYLSHGEMGAPSYTIMEA
uniref:Uncharacterized protein n=1 Tax=viral metagenome TaxID=1070528 RepID=A0A6M3XRG8_9ZZZZ